MNCISRFFIGFSFVFAGWREFNSAPQMKKWIFIPIAIDLVLFFAGLYYGTSLIHIMIAHVEAYFFGGTHSLITEAAGLIFHIIFGLLFFVVYLYLIYIFASIIGSPFYSILAAQTLTRNGFERAKGGIKFRMKKSTQAILTASVRGGLLVVVAVFLFLISFLPGLNVVAAFVGFVLVAFDMSDYALELRGYHLVGRAQFLKKNWPEYCGMGAFVGLTAFVPGLIVLSMPFAIVGATVVVQKIETRGQ